MKSDLKSVFIAVGLYAAVFMIIFAAGHVLNTLYTWVFEPLLKLAGFDTARLASKSKVLTPATRRVGFEKRLSKAIKKLSKPAATPSETAGTPEIAAESSKKDD